MLRADAALIQASDLSGGQRLRAGLASDRPAGPARLLGLHEPTNHLEATAAAEPGLRAYDGALLAVTHDEAFLDALGAGRRIDLGPTL